MLFSRRTFVKTAAFAAPAIVGLNPAVRAESAREGKLGVVLCGLGGFSRDSIAPEITHARNVWLAGVVTGDPGKGRAWARQYGFPTRHIFNYAEMDRMSDVKDIDIVHVVTPNGLHADHTIAAARAGKHVMVEKPMATSSTQCEAMIDAARSSRVRLGVNYRLQWEPHHVKATEILSAGAIGDRSNGTYEFSWGYASALVHPERRNHIKQWLLNPRLSGGGALFDTGVYPIQAACMVTSQIPIAARGFPSTLRPELFPPGVEETMGFELTFADGFQALGRASYAGDYHQCTTYGTRGSVEILPGQTGGNSFGQSANGKPNPKRLVANRREIAAVDTLQLAVILDAFADAIRNQSPFKADGAMGLRDLRIIEAIYASVALKGIPVDLSA